MLGVEEEQPEQLMESEGLEDDEEHLECFRCDLGFWDACYTTETNCSRGELCYTGRGKAGKMSTSLLFLFLIHGNVWVEMLDVALPPQLTLWI